MIFFVSTLLFLLVVYAELILFINLGWRKLKDFVMPAKIDYGLFDFFITVVVPFKDEEKNLATLLSSLTKQIYPKELFEVVFVNDHSTDNGKQFLENAFDNKFNFRVIDSNGSGKKQALKTGIEKAMGQLIVCVDADCWMNPHWLKTIAVYYFQFKPKMIVAPVSIQAKGFFAQLQALEFLSLAGSTAASLGWKRPIMANGANFIYERSLFYELSDPLNNKEISGDDVFLLHKTKQKYRLKIHYLKSLDARVFTSAAKTLPQFLKQRKRWAAKSFAYTDRDAIVVALVVLLSNLGLISAIALALYDSVYFNLLICLYLLKSLPDFLMLKKTANFFNQSKLLWWFVPLQIVYPFYVLTTLLMSFGGNKKWK